MKTIDAFILYTQQEQAAKTVDQIKQSEYVKKIFLLSPQKGMNPIEGCEIIEIDSMQSTQTVLKIAEKTTADYTLIYQKSTVLKL
ncbi:MAG: glycosyltransferase family 2 protein, partial [Bacteroidales bacterium]|nr:glycosyltransferase family 2 protein [Bacteroidales bacterium]